MPLPEFLQRWDAMSRPKIKRELDRILEIPEAPSPSEKAIDRINRTYVQAPYYEQGFRLLPDQAAGMFHYEKYGRGFFSIPVGGGKTALSILCASKYFKDTGRSSLLLIPSSVTDQFFYQDLPWAREHLVVVAPFLNLARGTYRERLKLARTGVAGCYVLPYSCLSTRDTIEVLTEIRAGLVIADEAHKLKRTTSARGKRFWSFIEREKPKGVAMSGTLTSSSPMDYYRLLRWTLGEYCPLPKTLVQATEWAKSLGSSKVCDVDRFTRLIQWAGESETQGGLRRAYRKRLYSCPGVHVSTAKGIPTSLEIRQRRVEPGEELQRLMARVQSLWVHPSGDYLSHGIEVHAALRELSAGFYYKRIWPDHPLTPQAKEHWERGQEYHKALGEFFRSQRHPIPGLDTPAGVGRHHSQHGPITGYEHLYAMWRAWKDLYREDLPERDSVPVRVDDYKVRSAVKWARRFSRDQRGGILWYRHQAVAQWLLERLREEGIEALWKGAGAKWERGDGSHRQIVVASIEAHHVGKNLQDHTNQLIVEWPRSAVTAEQLLGRTHRTGQKANRLTVHALFGPEWDDEQLACCLLDTEYQQQTLGGKPKLLLADWSPVPKSFPREYLRERAWDV